jgi:hypothetical protein
VPQLWQQGSPQTTQAPMASRSGWVWQSMSLAINVPQLAQ